MLFGLALAVLVQADLGLDPWTVFHQGISEHVGLSLGTITVISSLIVLALWIPLGERPGLGTIANALIVGPVLDLGVATIPAPHALALRLAYVVVAILATAVATGLYVGAGWGPGPRDGLMTGMAKRGVPVAARPRRRSRSPSWSPAGSSAARSASPPCSSRRSIGPLVKPALAHLAIRPRPSA